MQLVLQKRHHVCKDHKNKSPSRLCISNDAYMKADEAADSLQECILVSEERLRHRDQEVLDGIG